MRPLLIKAEPDGECTWHMHSGGSLPNMPEDDFVQRREVTVDSCSGAVSSGSFGEDETMTAEAEDSTTSVKDNVEDDSCIKEAGTADMEASLHWVAFGLQSAAEGYMSLASHVSRLNSYELPQVITQIPLPPIDVPVPVGKALSMDGENRVVEYLLCGEYGMANTSWSRLLKKYSSSKDEIYSALGGKRGPGGSQYQ